VFVPKEASLSRSAKASVRVLECDPELGLRVPPAGIARAREELTARARWLGSGTWEEPLEGGRLGFLIIEGLLARDLMLAGNTCTELVGEGDVLQPSANPREDRLVHYHVVWHVLESVRIAVLDDEFARSLDQWPQVAGALLERAIRRTIRMSVHQALLQLSPVETRLVVLLWFLAERWGRVTPEGINLRLRLSHQLLGQLVGCRRASVTTALRHVRESGLVRRREDGTWLLTGSAPDELAHIHWERAAPSVPAAV
jgi:hypothetical protein